MKRHPQRTQRRALLLLAAAAAAGASGWVHAQAYPAKPIAVAVGFGAGGPVDSVARQLGTFMAKDLGQPVVVENRPGAAGIVAAAAVAKARPDGYTLILQASPTQTVAPFLNANIAFDPLKDYSPISGVVETAFVLLIAKDHPAKNVRELIQYAKAKPKEVNFGSSGIGSSSHLAAEMLKKMAGVDMTHVPYKGNAAAITDILGGQLTLLFSGVGDAVPFVKSGRIRALGISTDVRSAAMPDVPTVAESGVPGFNVNNWFGLEGPPALPAAVTATLNASVRKALADPAIARVLVEQQYYRLIPSTPEEMAARVQSEYAAWSGVIKALDIKPQ